MVWEVGRELMLSLLALMDFDRFIIKIFNRLLNRYRFVNY